MFVRLTISAYFGGMAIEQKELKTFTEKENSFILSFIFCGLFQLFGGIVNTKKNTTYLYKKQTNIEPIKVSPLDKHKVFPFCSRNSVVYNMSI